MISKRVAGVVTLLTGFVVVTPLCSVFFSCGCEWPWAGLEKFCNIHDPQALHQCPWCISLFVGGMSIGVALISGYKTTQFDLAKKFRIIRTGEMDVASTALNFVTNTLFGIGAFFVVALVAGWFSAKLFSYPEFLG